MAIVADESLLARIYDGTTLTQSPILLDTAANGGVRIQDGGAEILHIRDSTNARGVNLTLTAAGDQTIGASAGELRFTTASLYGFTQKIRVQRSGNGIVFEASDAGSNELQILYEGTGSTRVILANAFANAAAEVVLRANGVDNVRVRGAALGLFNTTPAAQPAAIANADGTLADITTKFNTLLAGHRSIGVIAT